MELEKDVKSILEERFREWKDRFFRNVEEYIEKIRTAKTEEKIMKTKRDLLIYIVDNLPLYNKYSPFCLIYDGNCSECSYAKHHGDCHEYDSDYKRIVRAKNDLVDVLRLYYKGEKYSFTSTVKYLFEKVRDVYKDILEILGEDERKKIDDIMESMEIVIKRYAYVIEDKGTKVCKEVQKWVVDNLEAWKRKFFEKIDIRIEEIEKAKTIEEFMYAKKNLLQDVIMELPLDGNLCYFCKMYRCYECTYNIYHGNCYIDGSDYRKIQNMKGELLAALDHYYTGETYLT